MIATAHLYAPLHDELMHLLLSLKTEDWAKPTVCKGWTVQDTAAHMLDTQIRILSMGRDGHAPQAPDRAINSYRSLVAFLNELNAGWVAVARRMSPQVLTSLLAVTGPALAEYVASLDPHAPALFPVAWAGEQESQNWFDIARNYTEYWHHQQQIRDAVGASPITSKQWMGPVIETFVHAFRGLAFAEGAAVSVRIAGDAGGEWTLLCMNGCWSFCSGRAADAEFACTADAAWRFLTKATGPEGVALSGDPALTAAMSKILAVMA